MQTASTPAVSMGLVLALAACGAESDSAPFADEQLRDSMGDDSDSDADSDTDADSDSQPEPLVTIDGFSGPESAHWHAKTSTWFVSNIVGDPVDKDGTGWISRLDEDGALVELAWVEGLDAPKGLASDDATLYTADIDRIVSFDIESGQWLTTTEIPGAIFLNDLALDPEGTLYVSDSFGDAIYRIEDGEAQLLVQDTQLRHPNGLAVDGDTLMVVSIGDFMDFSDEAPIWEVSLDDGSFSSVGNALGKFDGIERDGDTFLVSDFRGQLYRLEDGTLTLERDFVQDGLMGSADIGYDPENEVVGVPDLFAGTVSFVPL